MAAPSHALQGPRISDERRSEKLHRHFSVQKSALDFHRFFHHFFHAFFVADFVVAFFHSGAPDALAPHFAPSRASRGRPRWWPITWRTRQGISRRGLRRRCKSMSFKRDAGPRFCLLGPPCTTSLSQTGEGFLLQFEKPRLTLSAEEEWLRACVPMRHQGKTRRACVDRSRRARPTS